MLVNGTKMLLGPDGKPVTRHEIRAVDKDVYYVRVGRYDMPWPADHMGKTGCLHATLADAALWFWLGSAHIAVVDCIEQTVLEGETDFDLDLRQLAESIVICFGIEVQHMFDEAVWRRAQTECERIGRAIDYRVAGFINSGGTAYRYFTRGR